MVPAAAAAVAAGTPASNCCTQAVVAAGARHVLKASAFAAVWLTHPPTCLPPGCHTLQVTLLADLNGHEGPVWQVAWAHPKFGSLLASCSFDSRVVVWKEVQDNVWQQVGGVDAGRGGDVMGLAAAAGMAADMCCSMQPPGAQCYLDCSWRPPASSSGHTFPHPPLCSQVYQSPLHTASVNSLCWAPYELGLALAAASSDGSLSVLTYQPDGTWFADKVGATPWICVLLGVLLCSVA